MKRGIAALALVLAIASPSCGQEGALFRSRDVDGLAEFRGGKAARALLLRNGFVVTGETCKQMFSPYTPDADGTYFVTVDTVVHTYTLLLEQALLEIEQRQTWVLKRFTVRLLGTVCAIDSSASRAVARFLGVGLLLQDPGAKGRGRMATALGASRDLLSRWRGGRPGVAASGGIEFFGLEFAPRLLEARGLYTLNTRLRRYHAARRFFQLSPVFEDSAHQRSCVALLRASVAADPLLARDYTLLQDCFAELLGAPDLADLRAAKVRDGMIRGSMTPGGVSTRRLLPALRTPSGELFTRTTHPRIAGRHLPCGLEVLAVGPLASAVGRRAFRVGVGFAPEVLAVEAPRLPDSIYGGALGLLASLQHPVSANAPRALLGRAWRDKQCATQLAGWAGLRTVWSLHAKLSNTVLCRYPNRESGIVSPYPEFFAGYAELARRTVALLRRLGDALPLDEKQVAREIGNALQLRARRRGEVRLLDSMVHAMSTAGPGRFRDQLKRLVGRVMQAAQASPSDRADLLVFLAAGRSALSRLPEFAKFCDGLSGIAAKQLERRELDGDERMLLKGFGESLARLHGYASNSWLRPQDDHSRSVIVAGVRKPGGASAGYLEVGLARPEILYVIAKRGGVARLYRGAVLSFRSRRSSSISTRAEWDAHGKSIRPPRFTSSFRRPYGGR